MNSFQKSQSSKILSCYDIDLIKGQEAQIGEERVYNGVTYVKHFDGWVYKKKGITKVKKNLSDHDSKDIQGEPHHEEHFKQYSTEQDLRGDKKIKNKVRRTLEANHATKQKADSYKSLSKHLLEVSKPIVNDILSKTRESYEEVGKEFKNDERQLMKIGVTYEILSTITNYCKEDDKIVDFEISSDNNRIIADLLIERDGEEHKLSTSIIDAGGYNIQQKHTRYLVDTDLKKNSTDLFDQNTIEDKELKKLKKDYKLVQKIDTLKKSTNKFYFKINQLNEIKKLVQDNPNISSKEEFENIFKDKLDDFINEGSFETKGYREYAKDEIEKITNSKEVDYSKRIEKFVNSYIKSYSREVELIDSKIYNEKVISDLPLEIRKPFTTEDFIWDKDSKTFSASHKFKTPRVRVGGTDQSINLANKTIRLENPNTNKGERFSFSHIENSSIYFKSTSGLNIKMPYYGFY